MMKYQPICILKEASCEKERIDFTTSQKEIYMAGNVMVLVYKSS